MKKLLELLEKENKTISVAESCTGGLISKMITDNAGVSKVFGLGVTTYSNEMKMKLLGVSEATLASFGAVSEETAFEMAKGCLALSGADIAVSVTGIAGPSSDGTAKKVGTVCFGVATKEGCKTKTHYFDGNREEIREQSAKTALQFAFEELAK